MEKGKANTLNIVLTFVQSRERTRSPRFALAHARAPLDGRDGRQARQHGALSTESVGLGRLKRRSMKRRGNHKSD